jgi:hypothetical protein
MHKKLWALAMLFAGSQALSAGIIGSLAFTNPTGTVGPTDAVPVDITLSLDPTSVAIQTDGTGSVTSGYTLADVNANLLPGLTGVNTATDHLRTVINVSAECSGTFFTGCNGNPYDLNFVFPSAVNLDLQPGSSTGFPFAIFTPTTGTVPAGHYVFNQAEIFIQVYDLTVLDSNSQSTHIADIPIAGIRQSEAAVFQRDVVSATPEPQSVALLLSGLGGIALFARRRKTV